MNTRDKRASVLGLALASLLVLPEPGTLDQGDRQQLASTYRGIAAAAPTSGSANGRGSAINLDLPFGRVLPIPNGSITAGDRQHLAGKYSDILAGPPSGTQTYSISGSGGLTFGATGPWAAGRVESGSGQLVFGGTAPWAAGRAVTGSGQLLFGGTAPWSAGRVFEGSGQLLFGGTATQEGESGASVTGSGGLLFGGTAPILLGGSQLGSGQLLFGGTGDPTATAAIAEHYVIVGSGGIIFGGAGQIPSHHWSSYLYCPCPEGTLAVDVCIGSIVGLCLTTDALGEDDDAKVC